MSGDVLALVVGTLLAVSALAFVLQPLFFGDAAEQSPTTTPADGRAADDSAVVALREIEFDRATGKLSASDYAELKRMYSERALQELRGAPTVAPPPAVAAADDIEARVRALRQTHRECITCGIRPEPDALYCSRCGSWLERVCGQCGAAVEEAGAAYCTSCGGALAASAAWQRGSVANAL